MRVPGHNGHLLFVYGTLRRGFANHFLLERAVFLGAAGTREKYAFFSEGIPYVTKAEAISTVTGEVYQVDLKTLKGIDLLEGHPYWYKREMVPVILETGSAHLAWVYFNPVAKGTLVLSGDYADVKPIEEDNDV